MKKTLFMILITAILIAACSTPTPTLPAPIANTQAPAVSQPTQSPAVSQPTSAPVVVNTAPPQPTAAQPAKPISKEFTPSDPKNVKLAAGKPQLVEFFAFW
jgi:PBP1b-binding outer membrane lipoprotein LpoB